MAHTFVETFDPHALVDYDAFIEGKRVKLLINVEHDVSAKRILFTLKDRHLPGEHGDNYFRYRGLTVGNASAVKSPQLAYCESPQVRTFLTGLMNQGTFEVLTFGLSQVELRYGVRTRYDEVVQKFVQACGVALSIGDDAAIAVLTPQK